MARPVTDDATDLDALEGDARAGHAQNPGVVLSLIARLRAAEATAREALDRWEGHYLSYVDYTEEEGERIRQLRDALRGGTPPTAPPSTLPAPVVVDGQVR